MIVTVSRQIGAGGSEIASRVAAGLRSSDTSAREPVATAEQKKSVALVPSTPPVGTA